MAPVAEQLPRPAPVAADPAIAGPVIACVDEGPGGLAAARIAGSLARGLGSRVLLATVPQATPYRATGADLTPVALRHGRRLLARAARELDDAAEMRVTTGEPAQRLLALAQREAAELLVVPAPGRSWERAPLLGSVYLALAGAGRCPVVVVPPAVETFATSGPIVCGVDGSEPSTTPAGVAADLAGRLGTRLVIVYAAHALPAGAPGVSGGHGAAGGTRSDAPAEILRATADKLGDTAPPYLLVERGPAAERLADVAEREAAQLLVAGSRGRGQSATVLLGSVASALATSATRPLMIVPPNLRQASSAAVSHSSHRTRHPR